jgi:DNA polymerase I
VAESKVKGTLLLIDGHALIYRAFFAMPALTNSRGELTNAAYGFTSMLLKVLADHRPTHAIAAFDAAGPTFRHDKFDAYKAHRARMPDELKPQVPWIQEICAGLGMPIVEVPGVEADDVIGTLARKAEADGFDVIILTGDLDSLQLVTDHVVAYTSRRGITDTIVYDVAAVRERYGFEPPLVVDFKALYGDTSDNIPGVPGIGEKTAKTLVQEYGTLESVLAALPAMKEGKVKRVLTENQEQARFSKELATIKTDVGIDFDPQAARFGEYDEAAVKSTFDRLEFRSLLTRLPSFDGAAPAAEPLTVHSGGDVVVVADAIAAQTMVENIRDVGKVAMRSLTSGTPRRGEVIGLGLAAGEHVYYVPLGPDADAQVCKLAADVVADAAVKKVAYDLKRELLLWQSRNVTLAGLHFDILLAAYLVNTRTRVAPYAVLAADLCATHVTSDEEFWGSGRNRRDAGVIEAEEFAHFAGGWVAAMGDVEAQLRAQLEKEEVAALHDELELPLVPILAAMERQGILVDTELLASISVQLGTHIADIEASAQEAAGHPFNIGSPAQLATVLYDELGLAAGRKTKTGRSTDADSLEGLRSEHPIVEQVLEWRQLSKLKGTYVDSLPLLCEADGRIHTSFNQAVAATGRLSSADPNLQNIPVRSEWGRRIREAFIADQGYLLVSADYSQIELRVLAHVSGEPNLIEAFARGEDIHQRTAAEVYHVEPDAVTPDMRRIAKVVNFGVLYGLSDFGLSRDTGMPREEAATFISAYFSSFPRVTEYLETVRNQAREWGWVSTFTGRRRWLPDIRAANRQIRQAAERMAINMPMQGAAADLMKRGMIRAYAALRESGLDARLLLQVHDELVVETPDGTQGQVADLLRDAMSNVAQLKVPLEVDVKAGKNWAEMTKLAYARTA